MDRIRDSGLLQEIYVDVMCKMIKNVIWIQAHTSSLARTSARPPDRAFGEWSHLKKKKWINYGEW